MKNFHRREFLKLAGAATAALAVDQVTGNKFLPGLNPVPKKNDAGFGIQLWSVRDAMEKDARGTLSELAKYGYGFVESYESPRGMFWGMKPVEFKNYLDSLGMAIYSSHCDSETGFEKKVTEAASIGMKHLFHAWEGPGKNLDDYKKMAQDFNRRGTICRQNGMRFGFHNHYFSFMPVQGEFPQDILMTNTDAALVDFQLDVYWAVTAGELPEKWIKKYPNRFVSCHIKDRKKGKDSHDISCILGTGNIRFSKFYKTAKHQGMKYYLVEQEDYEEGNSMFCAAANAKFMKKRKF